MAEWVTCPHCLLKHSRRPNGACPRCGKSLDAASAPPPGSFGEAPAPAPPPAAGPGIYYQAGAFTPSAFPTGARIAGAVLLINGIAALLEKLVGIAPAVKFVNTTVSAVIDVGIGIALIARSERMLLWARIRAGLGLVIATAILLATGHPGLAVIQLLFSSALLALLIGEPKTPRIAIASVGLAAYLALEGVGLYVLRGGNNPFGVLAQSSAIEKGEVQQIEGLVYKYRFQCPPGWYLLKAEEMKKRNPLIDRWVTDPKRDLHIFVIAELAPEGMAFSMDDFEDVYLANARKASSALEAKGRPSISNPMGNARFVHTKSTVQNIEIESYAGLFTDGRHVAQMVATAPQKSFPEVEAEFRQVLASFSLPAGL